MRYQHQISNPRKSSGSGLIIAIIMSAVLIVIAVFLLGKIIPFSRTIQWMETSMQSQYESISGAEEGLLVYHFQNTDFPITDSILFNNPQGNVNFHSWRDQIQPESSQFFVKSLTKEIPLSYDSKYYGEIGAQNNKNRMHPWENILLNVTWVQKISQLKNIHFTFETPDGNILEPYQCEWKGIECNEQVFSITISWVDPESQRNSILNIEPNDILQSKKSRWSFTLNDPSIVWINEIWESITVGDFFDSYVVCDRRCTIEIRLAGDIGDNQYLAYTIQSNTFVPDQNALLIARWESKGYSHSFQGKIPQKSFISGINSATQ